MAANIYDSLVSLAKRINVPITASTTPQDLAEMQEDPWSQSGKYALSWVYFSVVLLVITFIIRVYNVWGDRIRIALYKESAVKSPYDAPSGSEQELSSAATDSSTKQFFPAQGPLPPPHPQQSSISAIAPLNNTIAFFRWIFYRPIPVIRIWKIEIVFPSLGVTALVLAALIFVTLYCFLPRPLYYSSIALGSPPLAIRAGMIAVSMVPWIVALGTKPNLMYLPNNIYIYGTGIAAFAPLAFLCVHSLPFLRNWAYELFAYVHAPVAAIFLALLIWHCKSFLSTGNYVYATIAVWVFCYFIRLFYLNWSNPLRLSWLIGEESAVTILPENAVKVTIPTQMRWRPGQYVYLRMPGISPLENHPFTIASLCSDDFPSSYGPEYRDMALVFRPFGGFTRKVLETARRKGPFKIYRAFLDGPYGGMQRELAAFNDVVFFAGGSGITAIASQLLNLIKRMRDGKAVTKNVHVIWALKRPETMEWFKEELRICREFAPPNSVHCQFFLTGVDKSQAAAVVNEANEILQGVPGKRNSAWIREEAAGDQEREKELRRENEDAITELPQAYMMPGAGPSRYYYPSPYYPSSPYYYHHQPHPDPYATAQPIHHGFDFGFPSSPMMTRNTLTRFAYLPRQKQEGWRTEYGRPNITQMLREFSKSFGRRTCVFVCGPPSMRVEVANTVARLQQLVMTDSSKDEIFLHAENYAI
ncbi:Metalloreductase transmembrane component [Rasamsonia emersonii CBS 393.64]|uniref:ferric-chelate reductase (NADPH) n=1 Tax=Rasamsonia emersonii (strain ATCC 16479 / CBS 393.64 / IMI 116815) TaxID=1408163 RepID=A0A0F4YLK9_RASE3|nr:Metalloreductase transmembrane component [Rasamsonia emersonii CBS 393.64]KKA18736.1 Metalloreductase transmembrane component [Rasamsonia emersonii CBS 393.64]